MTIEEDKLEEHRTSFTAFVDEISNHYADLVSKASTAPKDAWEHWEGIAIYVFRHLYGFLAVVFVNSHVQQNDFPAFTAAIDWNERWIQMLIGFEIILFIVVLVFRNSYEFQSVLFFLICLLVAMSERINALCAQHWRVFAKQNYFDPHGTFAITLFSGPLLFIGFVQVVSV